RALRVGRGGAREDEARDDEDDRREAKRVERDDAERVVDRRADVPVRSREERIRPEDALELVGLSPAPRHRRDCIGRRRWRGARSLAPLRAGRGPCGAGSGAVLSCSRAREGRTVAGRARAGRARRRSYRRSWYGTEARTTRGSNRSSRFTYSARWLWRSRRQPRT